MQQVMNNRWQTIYSVNYQRQFVTPCSWFPYTLWSREWWLARRQPCHPRHRVQHIDNQSTRLVYTFRQMTGQSTDDLYQESNIFKYDKKSRDYITFCPTTLESLMWPKTTDLRRAQLGFLPAKCNGIQSISQQVNLNKVSTLPQIRTLDSYRCTL